MPTPFGVTEVSCVDNCFGVRAEGKWFVFLTYFLNQPKGWYNVQETLHYLGVLF